MKMKTKKIKKVSVVSVFLMTIFVFFTGCQKEFENTENRLTFLSIESDIDFPNLSKDELKTISLALNRIDIVKKNGFYKIEQKSGSEINISEKLFNYFNTVIDNSNQLIKSKKINLSIPRLKSDGEGDPITGTDCVAYSVSASVTHFGGSASFASISSWINSTYGSNGVPVEQYCTAASQYLNGTSISTPTSYNGGSRILIAIDMGGGNGHSGTLLWSDGISCLYRDDQNGGATSYCAYGSILKAFSATGVK